MEINKEIERVKPFLSRVRELCASRYVARMSVFGSVLTDKFNNDSDIDLLVTFDKESMKNTAKGDKYFQLITENYFGLLDDLELTFKRKVDLVPEEEIDNPIFQDEIDRTKVLIYGS